MWAENLTVMVLEEFASHAQASHLSVVRELMRRGDMSCVDARDGRYISKRTPEDIKLRVDDALPERDAWTTLEMIEKLGLSYDRSTRTLIGKLLRTAAVRVVRFDTGTFRYETRDALAGILPGREVWTMEQVCAATGTPFTKADAVSLGHRMKALGWVGRRVRRGNGKVRIFSREAA